MPESSLLRTYDLWARDGWAVKPGERRSRAPSALAVTAAKSRVKPKKIKQEGLFAAEGPKAKQVVQTLGSDAWVRDGWTVPPGVPRPRKPPQRLNIAHVFHKSRTKPQSSPLPPSPPPKMPHNKKRIKKKSEEENSVKARKPKKSKKLVGGKANNEESDAALPSEPPEQNYAALHEDPDTVKFKGHRVKLDWNKLWLFLCSKGWRVHDVPILNASDLRTYLLPGFKTKEEGGKSGTDYFLSHEGVLGYLSLHGTHTLEEFFAQDAAEKVGAQ